MASPPNFLYMTETLEVDKNLLSKLQMSKSSQTTGKLLHTWTTTKWNKHADQLKLALHRILPTSSTLHRSTVLVRRFRKSISYKIENILSEIYFASNFWSSYIPSNFSWRTTSLSTKRITTLSSSTPGVSRDASQISVNKPVWSFANTLFRTSDALASMTSF